MKSFIALFLCLITGVLSAMSQNIIQHAPPGFDTLRSDIPHGKIDTISYFSKTVGNERRSLIYYTSGLFEKEKISRALSAAWYWRR